jgi:hypothetical protein
MSDTTIDLQRNCTHLSCDELVLIERKMRAVEKIGEGKLKVRKDAKWYETLHWQPITHYRDSMQYLRCVVFFRKKSYYCSFHGPAFPLKNSNISQSSEPPLSLIAICTARGRHWLIPPYSKTCQRALTERK